MQFLAVAIALTFLLSGCQFLRRSAIKMSEEDLKNTEVARTIAKNCLKTWALKSGLIRKALGTSIDKLPKEAVDAMDELDVLTEKKDGEFTDKELGGVLGLKIIFSGSLIKKALKQFAPDVFKLIPVFL